MAGLLDLGATLGMQVHRLLGIKANPPTYNRTVATIRDTLVGQWSTDLDEVLGNAVDAMAALEGLPPRQRPAAARNLLSGMADSLADRGVTLPDGKVNEIGKALAGAYRLGVDEVAQPLGWEIDFQLPDADALAGLHDAGLFWIGNFYGNHLTDATLQALVEREIVKGGRSRAEAGKALKAAIEKWSGPKSDAYWTGLAATVATRARSFGALSAMAETGAVTYEYVNPMDERTSEVCRELDGTTFTLKASLDLRDRFLRASSPEASKAIAPWPKPDDLVRADGTRLSGAELQAKGIAWPPLHFHCRSTVDVATWGPMPDAGDVLGDVDVGQRVRPPVGGKPSKASPTKPGAVPTKGTPWETAKAALDQAVATARGASLDPDKFMLAAQTRKDVRARVNTEGTIGVIKSVKYAGILQGGDAATHRSLLVELLEDLRPGGAFPDKALVERVARELDQLDAVTVAYKAALEVAPTTWSDTERARWTDALLGDLPRGWSIAEKTTVRKNWHDSLAMWPADLLRILATEGETFAHNGRMQRGHAVGGRPGKVEINLARLAGAIPSDWEWQVVSHEWHHRLDGVFGGTGNCGGPWKARPGYESLPKLWKRTFGDTFEAAKAAGVPTRLRVTKLPHETQAYGKYYWTGTWVDPYEARIYTRGKPTADDLRVGGFVSGPVEFVAQAASYQAEQTRGLLFGVLRSTSSTHNLGVALRTWRMLTSAANSPKYRGALRIYGPAYVEGLEELHGGGARLLQQFSDEPGLRWNGDGDVVATALLFRHAYGVPLDRSLGEGGILRRHLSAPVDLAGVEKLTFTPTWSREQDEAHMLKLLDEVVGKQGVPR